MLASQQHAPKSFPAVARWLALFVCLLGGLRLGHLPSAEGQPPQPPAAANTIRAAAYLGDQNQPYGVATIDYPLQRPIRSDAPGPKILVQDLQRSIKEDGQTVGRIFYSISDDVRTPITPTSETPVPQPGNGRLLRRIGNLIQEISDRDAAKTQIIARRVSFLFTGEAPLRLQLSDPSGVIGQYEIKPQTSAQDHAVGMSAWWSGFQAHAKMMIEQAKYPPRVESYLVAMLSGRTGAPLPPWFVRQDQPDDLLLNTLKYLSGSPSVTNEIFRRTAAGLGHDNQPQGPELSQQANQPLPQPPNWRQAPPPNLPNQIEIEPIATRVPPECYYLRFGSFENYLWFADLSKEYGGDIGRMVSLSVVKNLGTRLFEEQIAVELNQMTRMFGPTVVTDQAVIGTDIFTNDGASMGVLIQSANAFLLRSSMNSERKAKANADDEATLKDVQIAGKTVSFLSTPDHRLRSFMAEDDGYFFITNSETLVKRFFEVGDDKKSLASTDQFRLSRTLVPESRKDTIFAYFPTEMLQGLLAPKTMIELRRRIAAQSDVALVYLARQMARAEGLVPPSADGPLGLETLIENGYLPISFGTRADGSGVFGVGDDVVDTMRGARGHFLPIADVQIDRVTPEEAAWYRQIADQYSRAFPQLDPLILAIKRSDVAGHPQLEQLSIHAEIAPLVPDKYGKISKQLGPPTRVKFSAAPDDLVSVQAHVASEALGPATHLFMGIKDSYPPMPEDFDGIFRTYMALRQLPAYLGAWPQPGALDRLPLNLGKGRPIGGGMYRLIGGLYRYTDGGFSVLSFQQDVLRSTLPYLEATEAEDMATVRGRVGSLYGSQLEGWVNQLLYQRAAQASRNTARFLNLMVDTLHLPPDETLLFAEKIMGAPIQCGLGGEFEFDSNTGRWFSTAWYGPAAPELAPKDYLSPLLIWFRGGNFSATQYSDRMLANIELVVARQQEVEAETKKNAQSLQKENRE